MEWSGVEWSGVEWFRLLATRSLALQEAGEAATGAPVSEQAGGARERSTVRYWRWGGQHLVRYAVWEAGEAYDGEAPSLLLVHGFAASVEQWERLVHELRAQAKAAGADTLPPVYALDVLGFGHAEKPGLTYTQHLWEAQIADFVVDVLEAAPTVLVGNSIGGGLSAGVASNLRGTVRGLVLCNSAGVLDEPNEYAPPPTSVGEATLTRRLPTSYSPVPLLGQRALDLFGEAVVAAIGPSIPSRLKGIYAENPTNADAPAALAIAQAAGSPGSANVIGSGQKLPPQRPLNEVLSAQRGFGGPVLVAQGRNDRLSGVERSVLRAETFRRLRPGVTVELLDDAGHCLHDENPEAVARCILRWLPQATAWREGEAELDLAN